ncbi:MAG: class I SAM-dependent methyltransferase [Saprospiraceae bacterium]|nr:class I SAM-dependent methyltransferase [Saprospiraceae bacterium]
MSDYYDIKYFNWQKEMGLFGGWAELIKFEKFIDKEMNVIDFGCGGGYLLHNINCKGKLGIEINDKARETISTFGIESVKFVSEAPDSWADCIISNHALEHVPDPFNQLIQLKEKLKKNGKIIFVVPCDLYDYKPNDVNNHLFCWSPMTLGNLFTAAGFHVIESKNFIHRWPPYYMKISKLFGKRFFNFSSRIYGRMKRYSLFQVRVIAQKVN